MTDERLFLDTVFIQGLLNKRDKYHTVAQANFQRVRSAREVWITDAILLEVGNALALLNRAGAAGFIREAYKTSNIHIVSTNVELLLKASALYEARMDKAWGLTDCLSFIVMQENGLFDAMTADVHFQQAGFRALLLEAA